MNEFTIPKIVVFSPWEVEELIGNVTNSTKPPCEQSTNQRLKEKLLKNRLMKKQNGGGMMIDNNIKIEEQDVAEVENEAVKDYQEMNDKDQNNNSMDINLDQKTDNIFKQEKLRPFLPLQSTHHYKRPNKMDHLIKPCLNIDKLQNGVGKTNSLGWPKRRLVDDAGNLPAIKKIKL